MTCEQLFPLLERASQVGTVVRLERTGPIAILRYPDGDESRFIWRFLGELPLKDQYRLIGALIEDMRRHGDALFLGVGQDEVSVTAVSRHQSASPLCTARTETLLETVLRAYIALREEEQDYAARA